MKTIIAALCSIVLGLAFGIGLVFAVVWLSSRANADIHLGV